MKIFTIGHSVKKEEEFLAKLKEYKIDFIIDVRSKPYSRFNPQFNRERLSASLDNEKINYLFHGNNIGGFGGNIDWDKTINELISLAEGGLNICLMCSESDPNKCHRKSDIQPDLESKGVEVVHILWEKKEVQKDNKNAKLL